ncbi:uncharacterized protein LOC130445582 [Diorhabda sublineata]|uniref:uncharacterized protein LOC130445582 n=1 Tax=Diorhabda sublineata TaxID=1163346 RepID=UPI0024E13B99|nr:uncharacterized protein LOC130445582 [Diorhabda sublineata]
METLETENFDIQEFYHQKFHEDCSNNTEKPFKCGICGHCTTSNVLLKVHMKMHLMRRQHWCSICKQSFNFISELNNHMAQHNTQNLDQTIQSDNKQKGIQETDKPTKQFQNTSQQVPLCEKEKYLLIKYVEKLGLNLKYKELEKIKIFLRNGWAKMVELFAENNFDRNPDKLARTYFHMKNQAKMHIERYYVNNKLPKPTKLDYLFIKLCPGEFESLGLDFKKLQEDGKINEDNVMKNDDKYNLTTDEIHIKDEFNENYLSNVSSMDDTNNFLPESEPSTSKRTYFEDDKKEETPNKIKKVHCEGECFKSLQMKLLSSEEERKEELHKLEMKKLESEINFKEEIYKKEIELKNLEILLLKQRLLKQD